jgi:hypothetical protein
LRGFTCNRGTVRSRPMTFRQWSGCWLMLSCWLTGLIPDFLGALSLRWRVPDPKHWGWLIRLKWVDIPYLLWNSHGWGLKGSPLFANNIRHTARHQGRVDNSIRRLPFNGSHLRVPLKDLPKGLELKPIGGKLTKGNRNSGLRKGELLRLGSVSNMSKLRTRVLQCITTIRTGSRTRDRAMYI